MSAVVSGSALDRILGCVLVGFGENIVRNPESSNEIDAKRSMTVSTGSWHENVEVLLTPEF